MVKGYTLDGQTQLVSECFALVHAPRRSRDRLAENCVQVVESEQKAREGADPARHLHPALVVGPARSSEGIRVYYLVRWLDT
jgi:hypothetical protein